MKLRDTTRKIISQLEEKSGYPVQVMEDSSLSTFAVIRIARGNMPAHVLKYKPLTPPQLTIQSAGNARWLCDYSNENLSKDFRSPVHRKHPNYSKKFCTRPMDWRTSLDLPKPQSIHCVTSSCKG